jgi:hypothetical protein
MKAFNYEVYTCNPQTGERGWDIKMVSVFAEDKTEARQNLKQFVPHFDVDILFNWCTDPNDASMTKEKALFDEGKQYYYTKNNQPI